MRALRIKHRKIWMAGIVLFSLALVGVILCCRAWRGGPDRYTGRPAVGNTPDQPAKAEAPGPIEDPGPDDPQSAIEPPSLPLPAPTNDPRPIERAPSLPPEIIQQVKSEEEREDWIEAKLEKYRSQIDEADVEDFRSIIGQLDMDYAVSLLDNPDAAKGEEDLKAYLRSTLTAAEYQRAKELFFKYESILLS